jgi:hypothetical protein
MLLQESQLLPMGSHAMTIRVIAAFVFDVFLQGVDAPLVLPAAPDGLGSLDRLHPWIRIPSQADLQHALVYLRGMPTPKIPITAAEALAKEYGFDQVIIIARKTGDGPDAGEAVTTYGINQLHCEVAGNIGDFLKNKVMGWSSKVKPEPKKE